MPITWRDELNLGVNTLDNQHKYLICLINTIEAAGNCGLDKGIILTHLDQLKAYTHYHFDQEERLQIEINFPFHDHHAKEHQLLIQRLGEVIEKVKMFEGAILREKQIEEIFEILRDWIVNHIIGEDMKMKEYFAHEA